MFWASYLLRTTYVYNRVPAAFAWDYETLPTSVLTCNWTLHSIFHGTRCTLLRSKDNYHLTRSAGRLSIIRLTAVLSESTHKYYEICYLLYYTRIRTVATAVKSDLRVILGFAAVQMRSSSFWDVIYICRYWSFGTTCRFLLQGQAVQAAGPWRRNQQVVLKRRELTTHLRYVTSQRIEGLIAAQLWLRFDSSFPIVFFYTTTKRKFSNLGVVPSLMLLSSVLCILILVWKATIPRAKKYLCWQRNKKRTTFRRIFRVLKINHITWTEWERACC